MGCMTEKFWFTSWQGKNSLFPVSRPALGFTQLRVYWVLAGKWTDHLPESGAEVENMEVHLFFISVLHFVLVT